MIGVFADFEPHSDRRARGGGRQRRGPSSGAQRQALEAGILSLRTLATDVQHINNRYPLLPRRCLSIALGGVSSGRYGG